MRKPLPDGVGSPEEILLRSKSKSSKRTDALGCNCTDEDTGDVLTLTSLVHRGCLGAVVLWDTGASVGVGVGVGDAPVDPSAARERHQASSGSSAMTRRSAPKSSGILELN